MKSYEIVTSEHIVIRCVILQGKGKHLQTLFKLKYNTELQIIINSFCGQIHENS